MARPRPSPADGREGDDMSLVSPSLEVPASPLRPSAPAVEVGGVTKQFPLRRPWMETITHPFRVQRTTVLHEVTLRVEQGEFFGLLGPNGAGKSTLFKILAALILPNAGTVRVSGIDCVREPRAVRRVLASVISDERSLYWRLSARENLRVYGVLHRLRGRALQARLDELLELVGLADTGNLMVGRFSSGMKQRLLIARALLAQPRVLLLDEPTRSLDPVTAHRLRDFLRNGLAAKQGCTILLATHYTEEAFGLCDRVGVLHRGHLLRVDAPGRLREELRDQSYELTVRCADRAAIESFLRLPATEEGVSNADAPTGWCTFRVQLPEGDDGAAALVSSLVGCGFDVARCEPVQLSLAELIERIVAAHAVEAADA
ncbi:MAG TPA: ABC transporter ATP-binding protein [Longimicrobiaceae bacterium]